MPTTYVMDVVTVTRQEVRMSDVKIGDRLATSGLPVTRIAIGGKGAHVMVSLYHGGIFGGGEWREVVRAYDSLVTVER